MDSLEKESSLVDDISSSINTGAQVTAKLETDEKVLARVTDGIYRLPGSALRELISNSYDADAENVIIDTDVPRFRSMTIRDDGNGMSIDTLVNLISHIGGSAKRSGKGKSLKVTDSEDESLSLVKKRKLIGKIGIGLFSVAQLTRNFEIVTKQSGNNYYLRAKVRLYNYSEEYIQSKQRDSSEDRGASFEAGEVSISAEKTDNIDSHGTDIILKDIRESARDLLRSEDIWGQKSAETESSSDTDFMDSNKLQPPAFHVGCYSGDPGSESYINDESASPNLPWKDTEDEENKLSVLYDAIVNLTATRVNPKLEKTLDNYLNMIWTLALSIPVNYLHKHPFLLSLEDIPEAYGISNKLRGQVDVIKNDDKRLPFSSYLPLSKEYLDVDFNVVVDGIKLYRPLKFKDFPTTSAVVKSPIIFFGSYNPHLEHLDSRDSGGQLAFDAYILWVPKVVPKDHNGVLVRLHNASGIMFDETFMKHQIAEHTIKSQLIVEVFVNKGLESALNIDRESFNVSHPHYQIIMRWLHQAIRQVVNKYKNIKQQAAENQRNQTQIHFQNEISKFVDKRLEVKGLDPFEKPQLKIGDRDILSSKESGFLVSNEDFKELSGLAKQSSGKAKLIEMKLEAVLQLLDGYRLLENMQVDDHNQLILDLLKILSMEA